MPPKTKKSTKAKPEDGGGVSSEKREVELYLAEHELEHVVNEVVNKAVREKPVDPFSFMSGLLAERSTATKGILSMSAIEVLDSSGDPTLEVELTTDVGTFRSQAPSHPPPPSEGGEESEEGKEAAAAEDGEPEDDVETADEPLPLELRDADPQRFGGRGVLRAVANVNEHLSAALLAKDPTDQEGLDQILVDLDGTATREKLGANALLAVSMAVCRAGAKAKGVPLYRHLADLAGNSEVCMPVPSFCMLRGGALARQNRLPFAEVLLMPVGADTFRDALRIGAEVYAALRNSITELGGMSTEVGYDGSFAVATVDDVDSAVEMLMAAAAAAGHEDKVKVALTVAADTFCVEGNTYDLDFKADGGGKAQKWDELLQFYRELFERHPAVVSVEDPFGRSDGDGFPMLTEEVGEAIQIVGGSLLRCVEANIERAQDQGSCNALVFRQSQVSTVTEAIRVCKQAQNYGWGVVVADEAGAGCTDTFLADFAVGLQAGQLKAGAPRGERVAKYNALTRYEAELSDDTFYAGDRFRSPGGS